MASALPEVLPTYLRPLAECQALLCTDHGSCYTRDSYDRHLTEKHGLTRKVKKRVLDLLRGENIANQRSEAVLPTPDSVPISGLPLYSGYRCGNCDFRTTGLESVRRHCSKVHKQTSNKTAAFKAVQLQTLWAEKKYIQYFEVVSRDLNVDSSPQDRPHPPPPNSRDQLKKRFEDAQTKQSERYQTLGDPQHKSEVTPWLRATGFHVHLADIDLKLLPTSYALPKDDEDPRLCSILNSVARILRRSMQALGDDRYTDSRRINRHNAKILNTFRSSEFSQRPLSRLQNPSSLQRYILIWQKLVCYYFRVTNGEALRDDIFITTNQQNNSLIAVMREIAAQKAAVIDHPNPNPKRRASRRIPDADPEVEVRVDLAPDEIDEEEKARQVQLDKLVLSFCVALIQQPLSERTFDSAIISFAAALAWDARERTWMKVNNYSSYLSSLIYDCQLFTAQHCLDAFDGGETDNLTQYLTRFCKRWLLNNSQSPVAELLSIRLIAFAIGKTTVNQAQIRWHQDGETLVYNDLRYSISDLRSEIRQGIKSARRILHEDLCFGLKGVPTFDISKVQDNWDSSKPGASFLTDVRNEDLFEGGEGWIFDHLIQDPEKAGLFLKLGGNGQWRVSSDAAREYEHSNQAFLKSMSNVIHKGSGQPSRITEFLGLRVCNVSFDKRNLFVHDGHLLFVLTYHKSIGRTNASRWPVRFLLPEVAQLLLQYLVLITPFRRWLQEEVMIPDDVSEYLWSSGREIWSENKMSNILKSESKAAIGIEVTPRAWRQIAVGIAIKKFASVQYQTDLDINGDLDEDEEDPEDVGGEIGSMANVFHYQAAHTPHTGNQVYGGTINFREGLTDAGVQEYLRASQMWHRLCQDPLQTSLRPIICQA